MTWDGVPLAVGGGAVVPAEAFRLLPYMIAGGREGVGGPGDAAVMQLGVAGAAVRVRPGAVVALNRGANATTGGGQAYAARNPTDDVVAIAPTAAGVTRYDLVCMVIKDPQYAGQPAPADVQNGPYVSTVVYQGVSATATSLQDVAPGQTGLALARVRMPPSTTVVSAANITDVRELVNPRTQQFTKVYDVGGGVVNLTAAAYTTFPTGSSWAVDVPSWATKVHLIGHVQNCRVSNDATDAGDWQGGARIKLGAAVVSGSSTMRPAVPDANKTDNFGYLVGDELDVPANMRGTTQTLSLQALRSSVSSGVTVAHDAGTLALVTATFYESANAGVWVD